MMKKITLLFSMLLVTFSYSQDLLQDFETPGAIDGGFGAGVSTAELADPAAGGTNGTVAQIIVGAAGDIWQGANITLNQDVDLTQTLPADRKMEIDVYSDSPISMLVRVTGPVNNEASAVVTHPGGSVWATLTATFDTSWEGKPVADGIYTGFVVFPNWDTGTANFINPAIARTVYFDNIKGLASTAETCTDGMMNNMETGVDCGGPNCAACPQEPTDAPSAPPTYAAQDVISLYGDAHGTAVGLNGVTWDGGSESVEGSYAGNNALKITNGTNDFIGFDVADAAGFVDATNMSHVHVDFWLDTDFVAGQVVKVKLSNHAGLPGTAGETSSIIPEAFPGASDVRTWYSLDLPLGVGTARDKVAQVLLIYTHSAGAPNNVYVDNFYLYNDGSLSTKDFEIAGLSAYPNPTQDSWTVKTQNIKMSSITVFDILGKNVLSLSPNKSETTIDGSSLKSGLYFAQIKTATGISSIKLIKN